MDATATVRAYKSLSQVEEAFRYYKSIDLKANRSETAKAKERKKCNAEGLPLHSFRTLLEDLGTICLNTLECTLESGKYVFSKITRPSVLQQKALDLLGVSLICTQ
jgi:hypothetical protein